jgi:hypothetical protein
MNYLTACAIFHQENSWLDEWIRYHRAIGVEHFLLCNDDDDPRVSDRILQPYIDQGFAENIHVRDLFGIVREDRFWRQKDVYREMIRRSIGQTTWLAIIDLDELILPRSCDDLRELLKDYEDHAGLAMNWCIYGSSGHVKRPPTQINHLHHHSEQSWEPNQYIKSIVRPERVVLDKIYEVHHFPTEGGDTVNENHEPVHWMKHNISTEKIRVNHYVLRSWQDFWEVKASRPRFSGLGSFDEEYFHYHDRNEVFDDEISRRFGQVLEQEEAPSENKLTVIPSSEKSRIKIVQYMHGNLQYFPWSETINRRYCERHGYKYILSREKPRQDRYVNWHKIPVILNELKDCDYLLFVDADAIFYSQELTVEEELISLLEDKKFLLARDGVCEQNRWNFGSENTGVLLMKVDVAVRELLEAWDRSSEDHEWSRWNWPCEQGRFGDVIREQFASIIQTVEDYYRLNGLHGLYIRHYMGVSNEERLAKMQEYCRKHFPEEWERILSMQSTDKRVLLPNLEINVANGCNLKCEYCSHFGRYMKGIVPLEELVQWYKTWSPKIAPEHIKLIGGEPLLHPDIIAVIEETRRFWPNSEIEFITNGLLFPKADQRLFFAICKHDVRVTVSRHFDDPHFNRNFTLAIETLRTYGIEPYIPQSNWYWMKYYRLDEQGNPVPYQSDSYKAWLNCCVKNACTTLMDNQLYRCPQLACAAHARQKGELPDAWDVVLEHRPLLPDCTQDDINVFIHAGACAQCSICPEAFEYADMYEKINPFGLYQIGNSRKEDAHE